MFTLSVLENKNVHEHLINAQTKLYANQDYISKRVAVWLELTIKNVTSV
jgi:hypothetical protein